MRAEVAFLVADGADDRPALGFPGGALGGLAFQRGLVARRVGGLEHKRGVVAHALAAQIRGGGLGLAGGDATGEEQHRDIVGARGGENLAHGGQCGGVAGFHPRREERRNIAEVVFEHVGQVGEHGLVYVHDERETLAGLARAGAAHDPRLGFGGHGFEIGGVAAVVRVGDDGRLRVGEIKRFAGDERGLRRGCAAGEKKGKEEGG